MHHFEGRDSPRERQPINFTLRNIDEHHFEIDPLVLNPGDWFGVEIYTAAAPGYSPPADNTAKYNELGSEVTWAGRIAGVECPGKFNLQRDFPYAAFNNPEFLQVTVIHQGWSVYFILLFLVVNLVVLVMLAKTTGLGSTSALTQLLFFSLGVILSLSSAEIAADRLLPLKIFGHAMEFDQPWFA